MDQFQVPREPVLLIHQLFCIIGFGYASLRTVWERSHASAWRVTRNDMKDKGKHTNVLAGLLLVTIATFCTIQPPGDSGTLPYIKAVLHCFLVVAMSLATGGLTMGSSAVQGEPGLRARCGYRL
ncbi:hypothetical protein BDM02DRAFT_2540548 [Thelephora ganbajun]|uniref:Uncharacterized protein n=1 Tax=Thelephora ganbajun TaxID=370292 RepID=A0ACB6YZ44_THEGA|nr:hypothetical protein BDM02DRAFT_2540548 [Thelephora ganbajun]